jgi:metal-responsive CopG/Arc/MetJ family transcriptional regulator
MTTRRLQVMIPETLDAQLRKAAKRNRMSKGEWVRQALQESLRREKPRAGKGAVAQLAAMNGPTGNIDQMLSEIGSGRR